MIIGFISFGMFSLIVGFAQNPFWMDVVCGVMGISAAMVVPPAIGALGAAYSKPSKRKNVAFACFSGGTPLGFAFGSIVCGICTKILNWRSAFWFLCIVWNILSIVGFWVCPADNRAKEPFIHRLREALKTYDLVGTIMTVLGIGLFTSGLTLGP